MTQLSDIDYIYAAIGVIVGIIMIFSPRTFMRGAKYDEDSLKTESFLKKIGIAVIILGIVFAIIIYTR
ncbi:hypothetical protein [Dysgonomonas sp. ZJ279]|uniref:hypothetical protein n=1 Tax=Dysgonomonas sp. ZJ279 TaxID=2709796 RepID=UPI0013EE0E74|nr:hypothetical protein [Dysgonomonas sp. ZJ279]